MIHEVHIENFKSIRKQTVGLNPLNVLIGSNGSGKSNFISLFRLLERLADGQLEDYIFQSGGINSLLFGGYERSQVIRIAIAFWAKPLLSYRYKVELQGNGIDYRFKHEAIQEESGATANQVWKNTFENGASQIRESILKNQKSGHLAGAFVSENLADLRLFHFHDTSDNAALKLPQDMNDHFRLKSEGENIAAILCLLKKQPFDTYHKIGEAVRLIYPRFHDFELEESPQAKGKVLLRWREKGSEQVFTPKQISDGTLRFICLATLLMQPPGLPYVPQTLILDEPELGLHPFAIHILAELIQKAAVHRQIILATQSVTLINHFQPKDLLVVERDDEGATTFSRKTEEQLAEWLEDYSLGQLWENNLLGGRP